MKAESIKWEPKLVDVELLKLNPHNPKIKTDQGEKRLDTSIKKFGKARIIVVNQDYMIINGHSLYERLLESEEKETWVLYPSRMLTESEYKEFNAMYDKAQAGEVDMFMVENMFSEEMMNEWDLSEGKGKGKKPKNGAAQQMSTGNEPKYPLVPQYDEKHEAIVILCSNSIDTVFIKNALQIDKEMSYKNTMVKETSIVTAKKFIDRWNAKS